MRTNLFRSYHYGEYRWDDYALDINDAIESNSKLLLESVRAQGRGAQISQRQTEELTQQRREQREQTDELLNELQEMRTDVQWGFSLVTDRLDQQIAMTSQVIEKLGAIHETLQSPLITQANELWRLGEEWLQKGLYDKALQVFLQSEQKNDVNFRLQMNIGTLYLEGRNRDVNVIDLPEAEKHLLLAARYAQAEANTASRWSAFCSKAYYRAAQAAYLIGEQRQRSDDVGGMRACLERALEYLAKSSQLAPESAEIIYCQAKCLALLGQPNRALEKFRILSDGDRTYYAKSTVDDDFGVMRNEIEELFKGSLTSPGPRARAAGLGLTNAIEALAWARKSGPAETLDRQRIEALEQEVVSARQQLMGLDVNIQKILSRSGEIRGEMEVLADRVMNDRIASLENESALLSSKRVSLEYAISSGREQMSNVKGDKGAGCLFSVLFLVGGVIILAAAASSIYGNQPLPKSTEEVITEVTMLVVVVSAAIGFVVGKRFSRSRENRPARLRVEAAVRDLKDWTRESLPRKEKAETEAKVLRVQMAEFLVWRTGIPTGEKGA